MNARSDFERNPARTLPIVQGPGRDAARFVPSTNQIGRWFIALLGFVTALWFGTKLGSGESKFVFSIISALAIFFFMHALGDRYWIVIPLGLASFETPIGFARGFNLQELTAMAFIGMAFFRVLLRKQAVKIYRKQFIPVLLFGLWVSVVYFQNPSGLAIFGGNIVGARFYFQLALGFAVFFIFASCRVERTDVKWLIVAMVALRFLDSFWYMASSSVAAVRVEDIYLITQPLSTIASIAFILVLARFSFREIFSLKRLWCLLLLFLVALLQLSSGKRIGLLILTLIPLFAAIVRREMALGGLVAFVLVLTFSTAAAGHHRIFDLPLSAQRALSIFPGDWDPQVYMGSTDDFRKSMRAVALREIAKNPWFGRGFSLNLSDMFADRMMYGVGITEMSEGSMAYASGSWHNLWLGTAADLGIPAAIIYGVILLQAFTISYRLSRSTQEGDPYHFLVIWIYLFICTQLLGSYTGGSGQSFAPIAWILGLLWCLHDRLKDERSVVYSSVIVSNHPHGLPAAHGDPLGQ